jgi:hypothetical protein
LKTTFSQNADKMNHILVLALEKSERRSNGEFENNVVNAIKKHGIDATSFNLFNSKRTLINKDSVTAVVKKTNASGVLVTQLKSINYDDNIKDGRIETIRTPNNFETFGDIFHLYDYKKIQNPENITLTASVKVTADLYSTSSGELIWSAESKTIQRENADEVLTDLSKSIIEGLKKSKLL